jgi:hypothetical protein
MGRCKFYLPNSPANPAISWSANVAQPAGPTGRTVSACAAPLASIPIPSRVEVGEAVIFDSPIVGCAVVPLIAVSPIIWTGTLPPSSFEPVRAEAGWLAEG